MLYYISLMAKAYFPVFNVVHYLSFRCLASLLTSLISSVMAGYWFLEYVAPRLRSKVRSGTPEAHQLKDSTPTMGGLFVIVSVFINCMVWCDLTDGFVWALLVCLFLFGILGAWDDIGKIMVHTGISARIKFVGQLCAAFVVGIMLLFSGVETFVAVPFFKDFIFDLGYWYLLWAVFIIVATSNAVNLTDGLDGLAATALVPNFTVFGAICYMTGNMVIAHYLHIPFIPCGELAVVSCTLIGSCLGFLWYNSYPAQIFMGDVGSLSLGAVLAAIALSSKQELLLPLAGGLFVVETLSVIVQVVSFKLTGKRMFKMAPIHHHFELLGWPESKITLRFGIISLIVCLLALITLKIR